MLQDIRTEVGAVSSNRFEVQFLHPDGLQQTVAEHHLAHGIIFIRLSASVLDISLVGKLSHLCGIHRYIAQLVSMITTMSY